MRIGRQRFAAIRDREDDVRHLLGIQLLQRQKIGLAGLSRETDERHNEGDAPHVVFSYLQRV